MSIRVIQTSPDLGLRIRLQRLPEVTTSTPLPPFWWGWQDRQGRRRSELQVSCEAVNLEFSLREYGAGLWVAVVEGVPAVTWQVFYTPMVWFNPDTSKPDPVNAAWVGAALEYRLPQASLADAGALLKPRLVELPATLRIGGGDLWAEQYWEGAYSIESFPKVPAPLFIAAGNTLSVRAEFKSMSGVMVARARVGTVDVGEVRLTLKRMNSFLG